MRAWHVTGRPLPLQIKNPHVLGSSWNLKHKASEGIIEVSCKKCTKCGNTLLQNAGILNGTDGDVLFIPGP